MAVGWSNYFADVMRAAGVTIPDFLYGDGHDVIAAAIVLVLTGVLAVGITVSSRVDAVFVVVISVGALLGLTTAIMVLCSDRAGCSSR